MQARVALPVIVAAILFMRAACVSADSTAPTLQPGEVVVPLAWAGVWDITEETTSGCESGTVTTRSYRDTLCAGETIQLFPSPYPAAQGCSGPGFTDTALQLDCGIWFACHQCCGPNGYWDYIASWSANWSLAGDVATTTVVFSSTTSQPPECGPSGTTCIRTTGTRTRVWPESSICGAVPVLRQTWGSLKLRYR